MVISIPKIMTAKDGESIALVIILKDLIIVHLVKFRFEVSDHARALPPPSEKRHEIVDLPCQMRLLFESLSEVHRLGLK